MTTIFRSLSPINLHLFDGAGAAGGDGAGASQSGSAQSGQNLLSGNAQPDTGGGSNAGLNQSDAETKRQDIVVGSDNDERRTQYEKLKSEYKDFYREDTQKIINKRFKETKTLEKNAKTLEPMLRALATNYNVDAGDLEAIAKAVMNDQALYEERAARNGVSVETQMKFDKIQAENDALKAQQEESEQKMRTQQILDDWNEQAQAFKESVPDFNLDEALENEEFYDLVVHGIPIDHAYNVAFFDRYQNRVRRSVEKQVTDTIRTRGMRPNENGVSSSATATQRFDVNNLTPAQIRDYANRAMRGEKITFK